MTATLSNCTCSRARALALSFCAAGLTMGNQSRGPGARPPQPRKDSPMSTPASRYIVRHGAMRFLGDFEPADDAAYLRGEAVVVRTDRGLEAGQVLCPTNPRALELLGEPTKGRILRRHNDADRQQIDRLHLAEQREFESCLRFIGQRRLQMELVDVEHLFGGERLIFYFLAEKRVDFRELVKDLALAFLTRLEIR